MFLSGTYTKYRRQFNFSCYSVTCRVPNMFASSSYSLSYSQRHTSLHTSQRLRSTDKVLFNMWSIPDPLKSLRNLEYHLLRHLCCINPDFVAKVRNFICIYEGDMYYEAMRWRSWLRHCARSRNVAGSIPDGVLGIILQVALWLRSRLSL
jgi:hypothetical protein